MKAKLKNSPKQEQPQAPPVALPWEGFEIPNLKRLFPFLGIGKEPSPSDCQTLHEEASHSVYDLADLLIYIHAGLKEVGIPSELTLAALADAIRLQVELSRLAFYRMAELCPKPAQPEVQPPKAA